MTNLQQQNPRLNEMIERDQGLAEVLKQNPHLLRNLGVQPSLFQRGVRALRTPMVLFGLAAQFMFMMRFVVQWISSERKKRSHVPMAFWYFSVCGGIMLLIYALSIRDPVFICGQSLGLLIYLRNIVLIRRQSGWRDELVQPRHDRESPLPERPAGAAPPVQTAVSAPLTALP